MDFVLRDAYMSGYNARAFDLERLLHYSFFSSQGLTIHTPRAGGAGAIHGRAGRAVSHDLLSSHGARDRPDAGRSVRRQQSAICFRAIRWNIWTPIGEFTEWSLLVDVARWPQHAIRPGGRWGDNGSGFWIARFPGRWSVSAIWCSAPRMPNGAAFSAGPNSSSGAMRGQLAPRAGRSAAADRPGPACPSPRHAGASARPELSVRSGRGRHATADRRSAFSAVAGQPPDLPHLCASDAHAGRWPRRSTR